MAKNKNAPRGGANSKLSGADYRVKHRRYSAASTDRKKASGLIRLSVWVPIWAEGILKRFAKSLCEGRQPEEGESIKTGERKITGSGVSPTQPRKKRKAMSRDDRQLDLFGPV